MPSEYIASFNNPNEPIYFIAESPTELLVFSDNGSDDSEYAPIS